MITIKQLDTGRNNNFDLLRFLAALMVIFSHSYLVTGNFKNEPLQKLVGFLDLGALGVKVFFAISGFLITKSLLRQPTLGDFIKARCLRIFPGLLIAAIFCGLIIGPVCTVLPLKSYFANGGVYNFMWRHAFVYNFGNTLPGTFEHLPFPKTVNSPVWTLPAELLLYLAVLLIGIALSLWAKQFKKLLAALPVILLVIVYFAGMHYPPWYWGYVFSWGFMFLLGACCFVFSHKVELSIPLLFIILVPCAMAFHFRMWFFEYLFDIALAYGIMVFAYHPGLMVKNFHKLGDCSYGLYIYAFPIQQLLILKFAGLGTIPHFFITFLLVMPLALLSWYLVEKPMLKLKR
jgi:peptidoglycan/LPS O-acetylase OafA/YrhL